MIEVRKTQRSVVQRLGSGHYRKSYLWNDAKTRFTNEVAVMSHLDQMGCNFVPRLVSTCSASLTITTTDCGLPVQRLPEAKIQQLYARLEDFGVRHDDAKLRNIVYNARLGEFAIIDFEFAKILQPISTAQRMLSDLHELGLEAQSANRQLTLELAPTTVEAMGRTHLG